ncbi:adenylate/guanylate cyclase domain-containing protein [Lutimonas halocynthiae]|uniref:adenylate/guanylate cyclase domain-containing protein n=1 Tax=Lutimonas halocynthiae TaxID=1446477 RepID=UPI0025B539C3|nr:adenylate/guanylate cyclase domain-containing protein [Lutimonas halocynthiae]MDN3643053.1 adenylate/guanylate cyclase domain-containing protein [Lutimonas halocynthiae]
MKKVILVTFFLFLGLLTKAQTNLDSLYTLWQDQNQTDSIRTYAFKNYIWDGFLFNKPDTAFTLAEELVTFAKTKQYPIAEAEAYNIQGVSFWFKANYPQAVNYYERSLKIREEIGDKKGIAASLYNIGNIYLRQSNFPQALEYNQRSLIIEEEIGNKAGIAHSLGNIGYIYSLQGNYTKALDYLLRSLKTREEIGDKIEITNSLGNIGFNYKEQGNYPKALDYYQRGLKIQEEIGYKKGNANSLNNIGEIFYEQGNYLKALDYFLRGLKIQEEIGDKNGITVSRINIGHNYNAQYKYNQAIVECNKGLTLSKKIESIDLQELSCTCLYEAHKGLGDATKALEYHEQLAVLNDSLISRENAKKFTQLDMQYEFDKEEAKEDMEQEKKDVIAAQELKRKNLERNGFMAGFAVVLLFAGVFFRQRNSIKKEKERSEELLQNILPKEVAEELKSKGHSDAQLIDNVTVLFTDFKNFTALSELLSPKELVEDLHACFSEFDRICEKYGIEKIKTIGDSYMAAGGLPSPNSTHAKDVVKATLEMIDMVEKVKAEKTKVNQHFFEIRIGVHTGPVVAGIVGIKKFQYDIWGDTVNTASRMESSGVAGKVNISEATYVLLKDDPHFTYKNRGKIEAKGKGQMEMYFVERKLKKG